MANISEIFGSMVFGDSVMKARLPDKTYKALKQTIKAGEPLDSSVAFIVANAMKDWAIEKGATHFTHWFQPMTGITAEKHDSFISPKKDGTIIMEFSGKELIQGEPDASSFPSGGLRATFEARGYTAWDPTSYAFIKDGTLCIPTAFCSYGGEALDKKTPLLRSMSAVNKQALRVLKLCGSNATHVSTTVGPEQEYFLIDKKYYDQRKDLIYTGRTLFGAMPPKGQEMEDHYFGQLKPRVSAFMKELDEELWKLGIFAKTKHNEVAPAQHELAPIFTTTNIASDHNQLTMEMMKKVALRHGLVCLLHEKPFAGVNGSGKHNNWSISTDTGVNLLEPGKTPQENVQFLTFLSAVIKAVDKYQDLMRISAASAGNDHRLGANEAPPAIISVFVGSELNDLIESIVSGTTYATHEMAPMTLGVESLPTFLKDNTDRNRTSPFAFTGNKFEFRMLGSAFSISGANIILNTIVADALKDFADELEKAENVEEVTAQIIKRTLTEHKRIISNGNNYSDEWKAEAEKRGLLNLKNTPTALPYFISDRNVELFERHSVFTKSEAHSRYEIMLEAYVKTLHIEALTMSEMMKKDIIPAVSSYIKELAQTASAAKTVSYEISDSYEVAIIEELSALANTSYRKMVALEKLVEKAESTTDTLDKANLYGDSVVDGMNDLRETVDKLEVLLGEKFLPYPTYGDMLFSS